MLKEQISQTLDAFSAGDLSREEAAAQLSDFLFQPLGFARTDFYRQERTGIPELIYGRGKTLRQLMALVEHYCENSRNIFITKVRPDVLRRLKKAFPVLHTSHTASAAWKIFEPVEKAEGKVLVVSGGSSDRSIVAEAVITGRFLGLDIHWREDCGIANPGRVLDIKKELMEASILIAVAGMEGALATYLSGLTGKPVIGVPVSHGYGTGLNGKAALLSMLNSCSPTVGVMNIDNGTGAAAFARALLGNKP